MILTAGPHVGLSRVARIPDNDNTGYSVMSVANNTMSLDYRTVNYQYQKSACPALLLETSDFATLCFYQGANLEH